VAVQRGARDRYVAKLAEAPAGPAAPLTWSRCPALAVLGALRDRALRHTARITP